VFNNKELAEIETEKDRLLKAIGEEEKIQQQAQANVEKQIQDAIEKAQEFARNFNLTKKQSEDLLDELEALRDKGTSNIHYEWLAVANNKEVLNREIEKLRTTIFGEEVILTIEGILAEKPKMEPTELGNEFADFRIKVRQMKTKEEMNDYENLAIIRGNPTRRIRAKLRELIDSANEILDANNKSPEVQEKRENVLNLIFDLEKFTDRNADELTKSVYMRRRKEVNRLVNTTSGSLYKLVREQGVGRLNKIEELLKKRGMSVNQTKLADYQQKIREADSKELQNQKYENEFLNEVLGQRTELRQEIQAQIQQS